MARNIYTMKFSKVYPLYVAKAEKKSSTKAEVDEIIRWLTGYSQEGLEESWRMKLTLKHFFQKPRS